MPKSPFLKKNKPQKSMSNANKKRQKFAIMDYYKKKNGTSTQKTKTSK